MAGFSDEVMHHSNSSRGNNNSTSSGNSRAKGGGGGLMRLFRCMSKRVNPSTSLPPPSPSPAPLPSSSKTTLRRRATESAVSPSRRTFSIRRKHRHGTLADMARSQSSEEAQPNGAPTSYIPVVAAPAASSTLSSPPPHARRKRVESAALSANGSATYAATALPVWGPPPALQSSVSCGGSGDSQLESLLQGGSSTAWNGMSLAEERAAAQDWLSPSSLPPSSRRVMRTASLSRDARHHLSPGSSNSGVAGGGLARSSSISSTTRARATCRAPSTAELNQRSSQFIGQWYAYPNTATNDVATSGTSEWTLQQNSISMTHSADAQSRGSASSPSPPPYWASVIDDAQRVHFVQPPVLSKDCLSDNVDDDDDDDDDDDESLDAIEHLDARAGNLHAENNKDDDGALRRSAMRDSSPASPHRHAQRTSSVGNSFVSTGGSVWAVSRGWRKGVYATYEEAHDQQRGFPGPCARQFDTYAEAQQWLHDDAIHAQRVPSIRTLDLEEELAEARKLASSTPTALQHSNDPSANADVLQSLLVQRSNSLRRVVSPPRRAPPVVDW